MLDHRARLPTISRVTLVALLGGGSAGCHAPSADVSPTRGDAPAVHVEQQPPTGWEFALAVDGSEVRREQVLLVLQTIRETEATDATDAIVGQFTELLDNPAKDPDGVLRYEMALTLGALGATVAVPVLITALDQPEDLQPKAVYKAAIDALGKLGDPAAVDALLRVQFTVADAPGTQSIGERAVRALGAIGEPAVPRLIETMEGGNAELNRLAEERSVPVEIVQQSAIRMLGVVGSPTATAAIVAQMPQQDCGQVDPDKLEDLDRPNAIMVRAFAANALGFIADPSAVPSLCACGTASHSPTDLWEITSALGRIGGDEAFDCLHAITTTSFYDPDEVANSDDQLEIRWEAFRWQILAAPATRAAQITAAIDGSDAKVRAEVDKLPWRAGITVLEDCKTDLSCHEGIMLDSTRGWFEREVAAFNFARLSSPGDVVAAAKLARAFKTVDPGARINIAWLTAKVAADQPCPPCAEALERIMESERLSKNMRMQGAWLMARQTIAKVRSAGLRRVTTDE